MSDGVAALVAELETAARAAWREEEALRTRMTQEIARAERRRAFAHRRVHIVRLLAAAAPATGADVAQAEQAAAEAQRAALRREIGWDGENDFRRAVLDRLQPVGLAVWRCSRRDAETQPAMVHAALEAFESWYEAAHGQPFYSLLDQEPAEVALVEPS